VQNQGFKRQPYYKHVHLVTSKIDDTGCNIQTQLVGTLSIVWLGNAYAMQSHDVVHSSVVLDLKLQAAMQWTPFRSQNLCLECSTHRAQVRCR
jgi:hypothetical protein